MPENSTPLRYLLLTRLKRLTIATVILYLIVGALAVSNTHSLCTLRSDLEARITQGKNFLHTHPKGLPGFPVTAIKVSIMNAERTVNSLDLVPCL